MCFMHPKNKHDIANDSLISSLVHHYLVSGIMILQRGVYCNGELLQIWFLQYFIIYCILFQFLLNIISCFWLLLFNFPHFVCTHINSNNSFGYRQICVISLMLLMGCQSNLCLSAKDMKMIHHNLHWVGGRYDLLNDAKLLISNGSSAASKLLGLLFTGCL